MGPIHVGGWELPYRDVMKTKMRLREERAGEKWDIMQTQNSGVGSSSLISIKNLTNSGITFHYKVSPTTCR